MTDYVIAAYRCQIWGINGNYGASYYYDVDNHVLPYFEFRVRDSDDVMCEDVSGLNVVRVYTPLYAKEQEK